MEKEKEYACGYQHCKHNGVKVPSDQAIKDGTRYYHEDCHKEKEQKKQITDIYYKYYKSTEDIKFVNTVIGQLIYDKFYPCEYVLFTLCQAIHRKIPFKSIYTLGWLVQNDMQIREKYIKQKAQSKVKLLTFDDIDTVKEEIIPINSTTKNSWEGTLFL
jgi:hypothetical protein